MTTENPEQNGGYPDVLDSYSIDGSDLLRFLEDKGLSEMACELCGNKKWAITTSGGGKPDVLTHQMLGQDKHGFVGLAKRAFYYCFCTECGNTKQFYADFVRAKINPDGLETFKFEKEQKINGDQVK